MKVAILTQFNGSGNPYSLINAISEHVQMFLDAKIGVKLLAVEACPLTEKQSIFSDKRIEWVNIFLDNEVKLYDYAKVTKKVHNTFYQEVDAISERIRNNLSDVDACIIYDILQQNRYLVHNLAIRKAQEYLPTLRFIAYMHSVPVKRPLKISWPFSALYTPVPNTIYVHPTKAGVSALAKLYNIPENMCRVVNNSVDIFAPMCEDVRAISSRIDLLAPDILMIYPARLTPGKKFDKVAAFAAAIRSKTGKSVQVIFCDFPSSDINPDLYKALIKRLGRALDLSDDAILFTSDIGYKNGFPRNGVLNLFTLSNLFVCPSFSESFGLIALEAASRGNFLVLNEKVPALEELGNQLHAYFMRWDARNFGFDTKETYHPSEQVYLEEHSEKVIHLMQENSLVHAKTLVRQNYSPKWVWNNQLAPLFKN